ncbi:hypothetical protein AURDEDRAFT_170333 [Auricularia subglabra TFB-10046 SS5]|nr:hypothetical protein AURDEDRAFT_170333 [Auricularia subglabra TFB-10046 SS5]
MHALRSPALSLQKLSITVFNPTAVDLAGSSIPCFLSGALPHLSTLSVYGLPYSIFRTALVPSLRVGEFRPQHLHYREFTALFERCPELEDVGIRNISVYYNQGEPAVNLTPIIAPRLKALRIVGLGVPNSDPPPGPRIPTVDILSVLPLRVIKTIELEAITSVDAIRAATVCFRVLPSLHSLEISHDNLEEAWVSGSIKATTPCGMSRSVHVYILDGRVSKFVRLTRGLTGYRTVKHLVIHLDWAMTFLSKTDLTLGELQTLTLTYNLKSFKPSPKRPPYPARWPSPCALLEEVVLDVSNAPMIPDMVPLLNHVLTSIIAFSEAPHPATLVLSRTFAGVDLDALKLRFRDWKIL